MKSGVMRARKGHAFEREWNAVYGDHWGPQQAEARRVSRECKQLRLGRANATMVFAAWLAWLEWVDHVMWRNPREYMGFEEALSVAWEKCSKRVELRDRARRAKRYGLVPRELMTYVR